jgi:hypothetical protein
VGQRFETSKPHNPSESVIPDSLSPISTVNTPTGGFGQTAVWTGSKMIVWGGSDPSWNFVNTGGIYDAATDTWTSTTSINAPSARGYHTAIWTGNRMIIGGELFKQLSS